LHTWLTLELSEDPYIVQMMGGVLPSQKALRWYKQHLVLTVAVIHGLVCGILKIYFDFFWKLRVILWCSITGWCDTKFCDDSSHLSPPQTFKIQVLVAIHYIETNVAVKISVSKMNRYISPCLKNADVKILLKGMMNFERWFC